MSKFFPSVFALFLVFVFGIIPAKAQNKPQFIFPLDCELGVNCWAVNFVDMNKEEDKAEDFTCGPRSYDNHKGTDFALRDRQIMRQGVNVFAAMDGTIERLRDGEDDAIKSDTALEEIKNNQRECGNGVFIDHGAALKTIYCHLKQDSITVKPGDKVKAGDVIGQIGQSGYAQFPHLHFGILWENGYMDPYTGVLNTDGCGLSKAPLWADSANMSYEFFTIYDGGFLPKTPDFFAIQEGDRGPKTISSNDHALVLWAAFFGVREGDEISLVITDPDGNIFARQDIVQESTRARQYYYTGRTLAGKAMPVGTYTGTITLTRTGVAERTKTVTINLI